MEAKMKFMELANSTQIEDTWSMDYYYNDPWCKKSTSLEMDSQYTGYTDPDRYFQREFRRKQLQFWQLFFLFSSFFYIIAKFFV